MARPASSRRLPATSPCLLASLLLSPSGNPCSVVCGRLGAKEGIKLLFKSTVRKAEQLTKVPLPPGSWLAEQWGDWKEPAVSCHLCHSPGFLEHWSAQGNENRACLAQDPHPAPQLRGGGSEYQHASPSDLPARLVRA